MADSGSQYSPFYRWVVHHDDSRTFIVLYIGLAVVLSAFISLFWLLLVVGVHFLFELIRQRHLLGPDGPALAEALWELRLDVALIVFAMAVALYMDFVIGVAGLRLLPRLGRAVSMGTRTGTRFVAWSRVLRGVMLSVDDAAQFMRAILFRKRRDAQVKHKKSSKVVDDCSVKPVSRAAPLNSWVAPWKTGDFFIVGFFAVSILLVALAPILSDYTAAEAIKLMLTELHPFPTR